MKNKIKIPLLLIVFGLVFSKTYSQKYTYNYILIDSSYSKTIDINMKNYIDSLRQQFEAEMNVVIGHTDNLLDREPPQSELSNLLCDILLEYGNQKSLNTDNIPVDLSLLNFGGIRSVLPAGNITIGSIYLISPFSNYLNILEMKGSELKKVFDKFTDKENQAYSNVKIVYKKGKIAKLEVNGKKIENDKIYRMATIDFVATGGDNILTGANYEIVINTTDLFRDIIIDYVKKHKEIVGKLDDRVIIQ